MMDTATLKQSLKCKCPRCGEGDLFRSFISQNLNEKCPNCGLNFDKVDIADGPTVFLIFILGFVFVPPAIWLAYMIEIPLWAHGALWTIILLVFTLGALKPLKSYTIALEYKHRPWN